MIDCVFVTALQQNNNGVINISRLNQYLYLFLDLIYNHNCLLPALYGDAIFATRECIVGKARNPVGLFTEVTIALSRQRILIEHLFCRHKNKFKVFTQSWRFRLMIGGIHVRKVITVSFFLTNCYTTIEANYFTSFYCMPPTLEEYLNGELL